MKEQVKTPEDELNKREKQFTRQSLKQWLYGCSKNSQEKQMSLVKTSTKKKYKKKPIRTEEYNNYNEKFTGENQQHIR